MDIYEYLIESKNFFDKYFGEKKICFLDIETTGLSRKYNNIYLIGVIYFDENKDKWYLKQFFANHFDEEKILLEKFNSFISKFNLIVTYNGDSFDIPFIKHRFNKYNINSNIMSIESFDIYRKIRANSSYLNLKNLKLKTIEESLGIYRKDEYSGKDCISFYHQYMNSRNHILKEKILKHNFDDLYYLVDVLEILEVIDDIKTLYIKYNGNKMKTKIENIIIMGDVFKIFCNTSLIDEDINIIYYQTGFSVSWQSNSITLNIEVREGLITPTKKALFLNKANFPSRIELKALSQYIVPDNIILLEVEGKYIMENVKNLIRELIYYVNNTK